MSVGIAIVGCGLIGEKRAKSLREARVVTCVDRDMARARRLADFWQDCNATDGWIAAIDNPNVSAVIVATPHDSLAAITRRAIEAGKHVLVEKPGARHVDELRPLVELAARSGSKVRVGFNHRYHRAFRKARELVDSGALGPLMFLRARYGHGGRLGYDREWRADPAMSGGGELIDQGVHLIDLARWFLGDFAEGRGIRAHLLLGHAGRRQRFPAAADGRKTGRVSARQLHRMEEYLLVRDLRPRRQARRSTASAAAMASSG